MFKPKGSAVPFLNWPDNPQVEAGFLYNPATGSPLRDLWPETTIVRLVCFQSITQLQWASPTAIAPWVDGMTARGIVVLLDPHIYPTTLAGNDLTLVANWAAACSARWKDNPRVWCESQNEPAEDCNAEIQALYSAWRGTGNANPFLIYPWMGSGSNTVTVDQAMLSKMTNVCGGIHFYGWTSGYSTDQAVVSANLAGFINQWAGYSSADGQLPVIIDEFGSAGFVGGNQITLPDGQLADVNWEQVVKAVYDHGLFCQWMVNPKDMTNFPNPIDLLLLPPYDGSGGVTLPGQRLQQALAAG